MHQLRNVATANRRKKHRLQLRGGKHVVKKPTCWCIPQQTGGHGAQKMRCAHYFAHVLCSQGFQTLEDPLIACAHRIFHTVDARWQETSNKYGFFESQFLTFGQIWGSQPTMVVIFLNPLSSYFCGPLLGACFSFLVLVGYCWGTLLLTVCVVTVQFPHTTRYHEQSTQGVG